MKKFIAALALITALASQSTHSAPAISLTEGVSQNKLLNPGFERGKASYTASGGTYTTTTTAANVGAGVSAGSWDSSSASQTLTSSSVAISSGDGISGQNGAVSCRFKAASGTATHLLQAYDGTNILASATITSSTGGYVRTSTNFIFPASGTTSLRVISVASNEPTIYIDDCYLGLAEGFNVSSAVGLAGTSWQTYTPTFGAGMGTPTNVSMFYRRVGNSVHVNGSFTMGTISAAVGSISLPTGLSIDTNVITLLNTTASPGTRVGELTQNTPAGASYIVTAPGTSTTAVYSADANTAANALKPTTAFNGYHYGGDVTTVDFIVPVSGWSSQISEAAIRPDVSASSWTGYHSTASATWSRTNTAYGDLTAAGTPALVQRSNKNFGTVTTMAGNLPGITFTPSRAQEYEVCAYPKVISGTAYSYTAFRLWDGTTTVAEAEIRDEANLQHNIPLCGHFTAVSTSPVSLEIECKSTSGTCEINASGAVSTIEWTIKPINQSVPSPLLVGSVTSNTTGLERIERAYITYTGGVPSVSSQSGSWISSVTDTGTGQATLNFVAGTFSSAPACVASLVALAGGHLTRLGTAPSTSSLRVDVYSAAPALTDDNFSIICMGPR